MKKSDSSFRDNPAETTDAILTKLFYSAGEHKMNFIPAMVGPFLEVTLVPESDLRKATLNIFFDMMQTEEKVKGNFKQVLFSSCRT